MFKTIVPQELFITNMRFASGWQIDRLTQYSHAGNAVCNLLADVS